MRFRFCGDLDCPDWILAEINTLARMTSVKMKLVCQQVVKSLLGEDMDFDRVKKLTADAKFESGEVKASVAALLFVLATSARHGVDGETLSSELQQLGLPREHATALCRVYSDNLISISNRLQDQSLRLSRLQDVQWRMDMVVMDKKSDGPGGTARPAGDGPNIWDAVHPQLQHEYNNSCNSVGRFEAASSLMEQL